MHSDYLCPGSWGEVRALSSCVCVPAPMWCPAWRLAWITLLDCSCRAIVMSEPLSPLQTFPSKVCFLLQLASHVPAAPSSSLLALPGGKVEADRKLAEEEGTPASRWLHVLVTSPRSTSHVSVAGHSRRSTRFCTCSFPEPGPLCPRDPAPPARLPSAASAPQRHEAFLSETPAPAGWLLLGGLRGESVGPHLPSLSFRGSKLFPLILQF